MPRRHPSEVLPENVLRYVRSLSMAELRALSRAVGEAAGDRMSSVPPKLWPARTDRRSIEESLDLLRGVPVTDEERLKSAEAALVGVPTVLDHVLGDDDD